MAAPVTQKRQWYIQGAFPHERYFISYQTAAAACLGADLLRPDCCSCRGEDPFAPLADTPLDDTPFADAACGEEPFVENLLAAVAPLVAALFVRALLADLRSTGLLACVTVGGSRPRVSLVPSPISGMAVVEDLRTKPA